MIIQAIFFLISLFSYCLADEPINHWLTDKQTPVYYYANPGLPIYDVALVIQTGTRSASPGLANLTLSTTSLGSRFLNREQVRTKLDQYGSEFSTSGTKDTLVFHLRTLSNTPPEQVVTIFKEAVFYAAFPSHEVREQIKNTYNQLVDDQQNPQVVAQDTLMHALFPSAPFFYSPNKGYADTLVQLSSSDLANFHNKILNPLKSKIIILGDIDSDKANYIANKLSDGLVSSATTNKPEPLTAHNEAQTISVKPDTNKVFFLYATKLPVQVGTKSYATWLLLNELLGGNSSSLLTRALQDQQTLVSFIKSQLTPLDHFALLTISGDASRSDMVSINKIIEQQLKDAKNSINEPSFQIAKKSLLNKIHLGHTDNLGRLQQLIYLTSHNLKPDYDKQLASQIESLHLADIQQLASMFDINQLYKVYVGHQ